MAFHAECFPTRGPIRITIYLVEGEAGCRVSEFHANRCVRYRSTATPAEFIAQHKHLGPWEITASNTGDSSGNPDDIEAPEGQGDEIDLSPVLERGDSLYGQDILSGRGPYRNILAGG